MVQSRQRASIARCTKRGIRPHVQHWRRTLALERGIPYEVNTHQINLSRQTERC